MGVFEILVKIYRPNTHPMFPDGGKLTPKLESLQLNETALIDGPLTSIHYMGGGNFHVKRFKQLVDKDTTQIIRPSHLLMIAGGTGIAPFLAMLRYIVQERYLDIPITLLFGNKSKEDILLGEEINLLAKQYPQLKVIYTLDQSEEDWKGENGVINQNLI